MMNLVLKMMNYVLNTGENRVRWRKSGVKAEQNGWKFSKNMGGDLRKAGSGSEWIWGGYLREVCPEDLV